MTLTRREFLAALPALACAPAHEDCDSMMIGISISTCSLLMQSGAVDPYTYTTASASVGPYTTANYWSEAAGAGGPPMSASNWIYILYEVRSLAANNILWTHGAAANGWELNCAGSGLFLTFKGGTNGNTSLGGQVGTHAAAFTRTAGGATRYSVNGKAAAQLSAAPTYNATDGTSVHAIGRTATAATNAATGTRILAVAYGNAALSDAELQAFTAGVNVAATRYRPPVDVRNHASLVSMHEASDWDGSGSTWVAATGSAPRTFTKNGTLTKNTIERERIVTIALANYHDNVRETTVSGDVKRHNSHARLKFSTNASRIGIRQYNQVTGAPIGVFVDGVAQGTGVVALERDMVREMDTFVTAGATIELAEGYQTLSGGTPLGTFLTQVRIPESATFSIVAPSAPQKRVVIYGDSITAGQAATTYIYGGYAALLRARLPTATYGVTIEAWGSRSLENDATNGAAQDAFVAILDSELDGTVDNILVMLIGTNDYGLNEWSAAAFETALGATMDKLRTASPAVKVLMVTPLTRTTETANGSGSTLGDYRTACSNVQAARSSWITLVAGPTICTHPTNFNADGLHPNGTGHIQIADALEPTILAL